MTKSWFKIPFLLLILLTAPTAWAQSWICEAYNMCGASTAGRSSSAPAQPTTSSTVNINPAAVPTQEALGLEGIYYAQSVDLALVKGLGRVGAAISPSNTEETFFAPVSFELEPEYLERKRAGEKLASQKFTLATAVNLYQNRRADLKRFELNAGVLAKYNKISERTSAGGGISGVLGPLTFGYAAYSDSFVQSEELYRQNKDFEIKYTVETLSAGIFLNTLAFDYSESHIFTESEPVHLSILTATVLLKKAIITLSRRREVSNRLAYDHSEKILFPRPEKIEHFGGAQFAVTKHILVGGFYNYYLQREFSVGATLFF